jgi:hypothetical protein
MDDNNKTEEEYKKLFDKYLHICIEGGMSIDEFKSLKLDLDKKKETFVNN